MSEWIEVSVKNSYVEIEGNFIRSYPSAREAAKNMKVDSSSIINVANNKSISCKKVIGFMQKITMRVLLILKYNDTKKLKDIEVRKYCVLN